MNTSDDTSTNGAQGAQCRAVISSVCVMLFTAIGHSGLNGSENVLEVVHNVP